MSYVARSKQVRHDGLRTTARSMTTADGEQLYVGEAVDTAPDGSFVVRGPSLVLDAESGTFYVTN